MADVAETAVTDDGRFFWAGLGEGKVLLATCRHCSLVQQPPSPMCPRCGSLEWDARRASGRGTILSWIVSRHPTEPDATPRVVVLVELEEGARLVGNLRDADAGDVGNDLPVEAVPAVVDGVPSLQFRLVGEEA